MAEDFEGPFPTEGWELVDDSTLDRGEFLWGRDDYMSHGGVYSAWPARAGSDGLDPQSYFYPANLETWMIYGPFDLSDASEAELTFYYWLDTEYGYDYFGWVAWTTVADMDGIQTSGRSDGWEGERLDLHPWVGQAKVYIGFWFTSDETETAEGPFLDDIVLRKLIAQR
jgi:hypothetical protein